MNVRSDRPRHKLEARLVERASDVASIPSIIKSAVAHRKRIRKNRGQIIKHHWHPVFVTLINNRAHPGIADFLAATGLMGAVDECTSPQSVFLRLDRVCNHPPHRRALRSVEPGNEKKRSYSKFLNRAKSLKIRISNRARDLSGEKTKCTQLRIN